MLHNGDQEYSIRDFLHDLSKVLVQETENAAELRDLLYRLECHARSTRAGSPSMTLYRRDYKLQLVQILRNYIQDELEKQ